MTEMAKSLRTEMGRRPWNVTLQGGHNPAERQYATSTWVSFPDRTFILVSARTEHYVLRVCRSPESSYTGVLSQAWHETVLHLLLRCNLCWSRKASGKAIR